MTMSLLLALPWIASALFIRFVARLPRPLPDFREEAPGTEPAAPDPAPAAGRPDRPFVSVVVPARNEAHNIERCLGSLTASQYPDFEVVVVDDRSEDDTRSRALAVPTGSARRIAVVEGAPLPDGWLGKPWACWQGAAEARGDVLLFTDADTWHAPELLARAVDGMAEEEADLLTLVGRQEMDTFWERLVQPHVFLGMLYRFPNFERVAANDRWRDAIANGQYILMPRRAYEYIDGHRAVRDEVAEDLALAQHVKRAGLRLRVRSAEDALSTRMYRSLAELVAGWSKNLFLGGSQSFPPALRPLVGPGSVLGGIALWLVPPMVLVWALGAGTAAGGPHATLVWASTAVAASVFQFGYFTRRMGAPARYGLLYPLGAAVTTYIFLRAWTRGRNVEWKGRSYRVPSARDRT